MIWSKQQQEINYSLCKTLQPFNNNPVWVDDLIFINYNEGFNHFLISCSHQENKIGFKALLEYERYHSCYFSNLTKKNKEVYVCPF